MYIDNIINILTEKRLKYGISSYMHVCSILLKDDLCTPIGINSYQELYSGCCYGKHAEMDALQRFRKKYTHPKKRIITINIIVIKITQCGILRCSMPCINCLKHLHKLPKYGYRVKYIYYSDENGNIAKKKLTELLLLNTSYKSKRFRV